MVDEPAAAPPSGWAVPRGHALAMALEFADRAALASDVGDIALLLSSTARDLGFRNVALVQHASLARPPPDLILLHDYPGEWVAHFAAANLHRCDPVQQAASLSATGFAWTDLPSMLNLSMRQHEMLRAARRAGLVDGFTVPLHAPGERAASCSFVTGESGLPQASLIAAQCVSHIAYSEALRLLRPHRGSMRAELTPRQRECVALVAQGKTDWEIGRILGLSEDTVSNYLRAARARYGVSRRAQLAISALYHGVIGFSDVLPRQ